MPAALLADPRPMGEGRHVAFSLAAGGARSRCVLFGAGSSLPAAPGEPVDAAVRLEANRYNGTTEPRLILRCAQPAAPQPIDVIGEPEWRDGVLRELDRDLSPPADIAPAIRRAARFARRSASASPGCSATSWPPASPCSWSPPTHRTAHGRCRAVSGASP